MGRTGLASAGISVTTETALRMMAVRACVRLIAGDIAKLPLHVYRRLPRGKARADGYPLYRLLRDAPNPEMSSFHFRETMTMHILLSGNAFAEIVYGDGRAVQLWPIPPSMVRARRRDSLTRELEYHISPPAGRPATLPASRMFHLRGLSKDGLWGISPIADARETIGLGMAAEGFAAGFFANGAKPSVVLEFPGSLSPEAHNRLRSEWEQTHTGLSNAQRVAILEEGMKASQLQVSPEDAQFIEQRKFGVLEIARLYGVQPHKIGVTDGTQSYASVEQANIDHVQSCIAYWVANWEQEIMRSLIPEEEQETYFAKIELAGLLRGDHAARANFYRTLWNIGAISQNDIREFEDMNPITGGDTYYIPVNTMPAGTSPAEQAQRARLMLMLGGNGKHETRTEELTWP